MGQVAQSAQLTLCIPWWVSKMSSQVQQPRKEERPAVRALPPSRQQTPRQQTTVSLFSGSCHLAAPVGFSETAGGCGLYYENSLAPPLQEMPLKVTCVHSLRSLLCGVSTRLTDKEGYDFCPGRSPPGQHGNRRNRSDYHETSDNGG